MGRNKRLVEPISKECPNCHRIFVGKITIWALQQQLDRHIARVHSKAHKCLDCGEAFDTHPLLRQHRVAKHPQQKKCSQCDYKHRLSSQVRRHEEQCHGENSIPCTVANCSMVLPYRKLQRHLKEQHSDVLSSMDCSDNITPIGQLNPQIEMLLGDKLLPISAPEKKIVNIETFKLTSNLLHECPKCGQKRNDRRSLMRHIARVHEKRYKPKVKKDYHCAEDSCDQKFSTARALQKHQETHSVSEKLPFSCDNCSRSFFARAEFARHLRRYHAVSIRQVTNELQQTLGNMELLVDDAMSPMKAS